LAKKQAFQACFWGSGLGQDTHIATPLRRKLQQDILAQMREARSQIDPAILQQAKDAILNAHRPNTGDEPVDKAKTLTMVKEYLSLMRDNKAVCHKVGGMIGPQGLPVK
jgi:hypothetical protein